MLSILLTITLASADSVKIKATTHPTYNVMAYNMDDVKKKKKKKGFWSKVFGAK